jgi:hypothetical protein
MRTDAVIHRVASAYEVISTFLDDEPFDPNALALALSAPAGRDLLIDLIALRQLTLADGKAAPAWTDHKQWRSSPRALVAAAAVVVALVGGYLVGDRRREAAISAAPPATRVVEAPAAWQDVPVGRMR